MLSLEMEKFIADLTDKTLLDIYTLTHCMTVLQS